MADFGSPVIFGSYATMALFDQPDTDIVSGHVQSTGYRIEYPATDLPGLSQGDSLLIGIGSGWSLTADNRLQYTGPYPDGAQSATFRVLGSPNLLDDGMFLEARLEKV